jgi:hypothetical protein
MTQPTQREALPIWEQIIEAMKQGISDCRKEFSGTEDDDDLIAFMYPKIHNVLLEALQSPEMETAIFNEITKLCRRAPNESSLANLLPSHRNLITAAAIQAIVERVR